MRYLIIASLLLMGCASLRHRDDADEHNIEWMRAHGELPPAPSIDPNTLPVERGF
jgi:hypothetical protein